MPVIEEWGPLPPGIKGRPGTILTSYHVLSMLFKDIHYPRLALSLKFIELGTKIPILHTAVHAYRWHGLGPSNYLPVAGHPYGLSGLAICNYIHDIAAALYLRIIRIDNGYPSNIPGATQCELKAAD